MTDAVSRLKHRLARVAQLRETYLFLLWDQQTMMPPAGAAARAAYLETVFGLAHELLVDDETGRLLEAVRPYEESLDYDSDDASLIRFARREYEKQARVPVELRAEMARAASEGLAAWQAAKEASDFSRFLPALERNVELRRRYVELFAGEFDEPYDVLLDDFEPEVRSAQVRAVFERLKPEQLALVAEAAERGDPSLEEVAQGEFPADAQLAISHEVIELFGLRPDTWRLDPTEHPFAGGPSRDDLRITTHYYEASLESLFATMHEYGHALYEHQIAPELDLTLLGRGASYGLHESQSRMWENLVGRSLPFWRFFYPRTQELFPRALGGVDLDTFYRAINRVQPSLIRIHADEASYNLHVILRFELEQDIVNDRVELRELPQIWNERMHEYLGVEVPDDARGVLQDVHWSAGQIGYFSTYALGNVMSAQIWERVLSDIPDLYERFERGEFSPLREWLGDRLHRHGRKFTPTETLAKVVGGPIDPEPYVRYLREKHGTAALA